MHSFWVAKILEFQKYASGVSLDFKHKGVTSPIDDIGENLRTIIFLHYQ